MKDQLHAGMYLFDIQVILKFILLFPFDISSFIPAPRRNIVYSIHKHILWERTGKHLLPPHLAMEIC
jgi:hypothetical protein